MEQFANREFDKIVKQKFLIFGGAIILAFVLIGLNTASYVQKAKDPDSELNPNRSTFNVGATGTRAFYDFLVESGYKVRRWRDPVSDLKNFDAAVVSTFVIIGKVKREFTDEEITKLMNWVSSGGTLVIIDRDPPRDLISSTSYYAFEISGGEKSMSEMEKDTMILSVDPASKEQMTADTKAARVLLPSSLTLNVNAVQPSKFSSFLKFTRIRVSETDNKSSETLKTIDDNSNTVEDSGVSSPTAANSKAEDVPNDLDSAQSAEDEVRRKGSLSAPVAHIGSDSKTILADFPFDAGRVIFLTDPYIVANGGINLADNVQLAANIAASRGGIIAFDEFHQGYSRNENMMLAYFAGTPMVAIFLQLLALAAVILYSQSRRFARALPLKEPDRLSKLEYVSAMAQLQRRTKAFDLAIENIYSDFRRRVSRLVGVDNHTTSRPDLAKLVADRTEYSAGEIDELLFKCEEIMIGEPTRKKEVIELTGKLREVEKRLGLRRRGRKH